MHRLCCSSSNGHALKFPLKPTLIFLINSSLYLICGFQSFSLKDTAAAKNICITNLCLKKNYMYILYLTQLNVINKILMEGKKKIDV